MKMTFDLDQLTIGDLVDIEEVSGVTLDGLDLSKPPLKLLPAMIWVFNRKSDPSYTYDQARETKLTEMVIEGENPTLAVAAGDGGIAAVAVTSSN